ncbi:MAG: hypothetical protein LVQ95_05760 [Candidatus Micrarchaeales archaeon]|nr:hypothetical protein [Candidatus Micrarchaeales archaeon]
MVEKDESKAAFKIGGSTYFFTSIIRAPAGPSLDRIISTCEYTLSKEEMKPEVSKWLSLALMVKLIKSEPSDSSSTKFDLTAYFEDRGILTSKMITLAQKAATELFQQYPENGLRLSQGGTPFGKFYIAIIDIGLDNLLAIEKAFREKMIEVAQQQDRMEQSILVADLVRHAQEMARTRAV